MPPVRSARCARTAAGLLAAALGVAALTGCSVRPVPVDPGRLGGLAQTSVVRAADGSLLTTLHAEQDRRPLALADVPPVVVQAVLAAEDRRFYEHTGVDVRGIARAAHADASTGDAGQGGSTITQQLVKNTLVTPEKSVRRKVREAALALGLEQTMTKDQILERYLNTVYFGHGAYGVGAAVRTYFGHTPDRVSLPEAALLAGLIRSPATTDPIDHPAVAQRRRAGVLAGMVETGAVAETQARTAARAPLPRRVFRDDRRYPAAHAVQDAVSTLLADKRLGATPAERANLLYKGGVTVTLTIDPQQQAEAEAALAGVLDGPNEPDAAVAAVQPGDGAITAMVSSRDFFAPRDPLAKVNLARGGSTKRQAGSTYKMFTLVAALERGITPEDRFEAGATATLARRFGPTWEVDNYEGTAYGRITLRTATEDSVNTAYAHVVERLGKGDPDRGAAIVADTATRLGITGPRGTPVRRDPSSTLGAQEVDPVQLAAAYATLASGGTYAKPYLVASVTGPDGRVLLRTTPQRRRAVPQGVAAVANDVLRGVIGRGTGVRARLPRAVAGKTGTASAYRDAWFVGYTPNFAAAVWMGQARRPVPMTPENGYKTVIAGGTLPAEVWRRFASRALLGQPAPAFASPAGATVRVDIDVVRNCRANQWTPRSQVVTRTYLTGTAPAAVCRFPAGPPATSVPSVLGLRSAAAHDALDRAGFVVVERAVFDRTYPAGTVVAQEPASGTAVAPGARVTVSVAGRAGVRSPVPDLLGLSAVDAARALAAVGLVPAPVVEASCTTGTRCAATRSRDAGRVWRQDRRAGDLVDVGSAVRYAVGPF